MCVCMCASMRVCEEGGKAARLSDRRLSLIRLQAWCSYDVSLSEKETLLCRSLHKSSEHVHIYKLNGTWPAAY